MGSEMCIRDRLTEAGIVLPVGIPDVETWGRTLAQHGTKVKGMRYADIITDKVYKTYVNWVRQRYGAGGDKYGDFRQYVIVKDQLLDACVRRKVRIHQILHARYAR